jgi:hypothetical protein
MFKIYLVNAPMVFRAIWYVKHEYILAANIQFPHECRMTGRSLSRGCTRLPSLK